MIFPAGLDAITILEFTPAADEIWGLSMHPKAGYADRKSDDGTITFFDIPQHDSKLRPDVRAVYAGGKATNVARVLEKLIDVPGGFWPFDARRDLSVRLKTFLPAADPDDAASFSPGGAYIAALQRAELHRVELSFVAFPYHDGPLRDRRCIHLFDDESGTDLLNFSPPLSWDTDDAAFVREYIRANEPCGALVLAGSAPRGAETVYAAVIESARRQSCPFISVDIDTASLLTCLSAPDAWPDVVSVNRSEFEAITEWLEFGGIIHLHDRHGSEIVSARSSRRGTCVRLARLAEQFGPASGPTIGAGDAAHAGFLFGTLATPLSTREAMILGQATAAAAVRNETGTRDLEANQIRSYYTFLAAAYDD